LPQRFRPGNWAGGGGIAGIIHVSSIKNLEARPLAARPRVNRWLRVFGLDLSAGKIVDWVAGEVVSVAKAPTRGNVGQASRSQNTIHPEKAGLKGKFKHADTIVPVKNEVARIVLLW